MAKREAFTFESNLDKINEKIKDKPYRVLNVVGLSIVKEVRTTLRKYYKIRTGKLDKSLGYWARKKERDLQIGFKKFYARMVIAHNDPIKPIVEKNAQNIADLITKALQEIENDKN